VTQTITGARVTSGGATYKRLETDNYTLTDFVARDWGGLISVQKRAGVVRNLTVTNGKCYNIDRVITLPYDDAELDTALFEDLDCYDLERGFIRMKKARNVTLRRIIARQRTLGTTQFADAFATSNLPTLNLKFEDVSCIGFDMIVPAGAYPNGGAFSDEELSVNTSYLRCVARDGNDGWDLKGEDHATACRSQNNNRNWRFWGSTTITDCWSVDAHNAFFWFGGGSRLGACKLVRPRIVVPSGNTTPWFKIDTHTSAASITVVDPIDGNGNLIPSATLLSHVKYDATKLLTFTVQYTGASSGPANFPPVDTTPRPPIISAGGGGGSTPTPPPDETLAPPTDVRLSYDVFTGRATLTWTPPSGAVSVDVFERTNTPTVALGNYPIGTNQRVSAVLKVPGEYTFTVAAVFASGNRSLEVPPVNLPTLVLPLETPPVDTDPTTPPPDPELPPDPDTTPEPPADIHGLVYATAGGVRKIYRVLRSTQTPTGPGTTPTTALTWAQIKSLASTSNRPIIIAHQGGGAGISKSNALSSIDQALALGLGSDDHMVPDGGDFRMGADGQLYNSFNDTTGAFMDQDVPVSGATLASWAALRLKDFPTYRGTISNEAPPTGRQWLEKIRSINKFTVTEDKQHSTASRNLLRDFIQDLGMDKTVQVQSNTPADLGPAKTAGIAVGLLQNAGNDIGAAAILTSVNGGPPDAVQYDPRVAPGNSDAWVKAMIDAGISLQVGILNRRYDLDKEKVRVANLGGRITLVSSDFPFYLGRKNVPLLADRWDTQYWENGQISSDQSIEPQVQSNGSLRFGNAAGAQWVLLGGFADETKGCWRQFEFDATFEALDTTDTRWVGLEWGLADDRNYHDGTENSNGSIAVRFGQDGRIRIFNRTSPTAFSMTADNVSVGMASSTTLNTVAAGQTVRLRVENLVDANGAFTSQARVTRLDTGQWVMTAVGDAPVRGPYMHLGKNGTAGSIIRVANLAAVYSTGSTPPPVPVTPPAEVAAITELDSEQVVYELDVGTGPQSTWTIPRPTTGGALAAGDCLIFSFSLDVKAAPMPAFTAVPTGAVPLVPATLVSGSATSVLGSAVYYKLVTTAEATSPPASYAFTLDGAYDGTASVVRFRGVDPATPFTITDAGNVVVSTITNTTNVSKTSPSVTTTSGNAMLVAGVTHRSGSSLLTAGDPAGYTLDVNAFGVGGRAHAVAHAVQATAGASPTAVWHQSSGGVGLMWQTALRRAGATTTTPTTPAIPGATAPTVAQRIVSDVTDTTAMVTVKVAGATSVRLKCGTDDAVSTGVVFGTPVVPDSEGCAFLPVTGLTGNKTNYRYRVAMTDANGVEVLDTLAVGRFRTDGTGALSFSFASCNDTSDPDTFNGMAAWDDDMFIHLGDMYYFDGSGTGLANFKTRMDQRLSAPRASLVYSTRHFVYTTSDHDGMNNNTTAANNATAWANWNTLYRSRILPASRLPSNGVYRTFTKRAGLVRFIVLDTRSFASSASAVDNTSKTRLGATQKQWLKDTITAATESVIVLVNADPWIGATVVGGDAWPGYNTERSELAAFFVASGKSIFITGGDMHALAADTGVNSAGGIAVFHAAPFYHTASDKGGPYSEGRYPPTGTATVKQYGRIVITPGTTTVTVTYFGYSAPNTQRMTLTKTYPL
jgi:phosphodiesterase/alkaline phosphatase D-like protein